MNKRRYHELMTRLERAGFSFDEANKLRRIEMTLHRWCEHEANGNIQRDGDDSDGKPRWYYNLDGPGKPNSYSIADRERGALKRLDALMAAHPEYVSYYQGDCRGCALYIVAKADIGAHKVNEIYSRGIAVCD